MDLFAQAYPNSVFADASPENSTNDLPLHRIPFAHDPRFCDTVLTIMKADGCELLIPGVDEELPVLESLRREGVNILMPDQRYVTVMLDKLAAMKWLAEESIPVPRTVVVKPRQGRGSEGVLIEQERLEGQEYSVMMCADQQKTLRAIVPVRIMAKRRITMDGITTNEPYVLQRCREIHEAIPTIGVYNIQGVLTADRGFLPFEINPRISTTTGLAVLAGADIIDYWQRDDLPERVHTVGSGWRIRRTWKNTIQST